MPKSPLKVETTNQFRKDFKKLVRMIPKIRGEVEKVVDFLSHQEPLPPKYRDQIGNKRGPHRSQTFFVLVSAPACPLYRRKLVD